MPVLKPTLTSLSIPASDAVLTPAQDTLHPPASTPGPPRGPNGFRARPLTALRSVSPRPSSSAVINARELWLGVHLREARVPTKTNTETFTREQALASMRVAALSVESALVPLATRAERFTPRVSLAPPDGLLLEVKGSLHLFNGTEGLRRAFMDECFLSGVKASFAIAPTPLASLVAARVGEPFVVTDTAQVVGKLASMPIAALRWSEKTLERLALMGIRTIGQVLRLPRAGFARRFGTEPLLMLDHLTGRAPDLRRPFRAKERFRRRRDLGYELENHDAVLASLAPLMAELGRFLEARQCGVLEIECLMRHRHAPPTSCVLRLAAPAADVTRMTALLSERLNAIVLPEPVRSCELRSGDLVSRSLDSTQLWQPGEHGGGLGPVGAELIEGLRARLGPEAVYGLQVLQSHRPENAWRATEPGGLDDIAPVAVGKESPSARLYRARTQSGRTFAAQVPWPAFRRPLWLLPTPEVIAERDGVPWRRGALRILGEPERLETGWWEGVDIARDYYTVVDIHGVRLWLFREVEAPRRWFLHGIFG